MGSHSQPARGSRQGEHRRLTKMLILAALTALSCVGAQVFRLPDAEGCTKRVIHTKQFGKSYHFSWLEAGRDTTWGWEGARNYCRKFCMDSISITTKEENEWVTGVLRKDDIRYIWTGGRKCNFKGCDRADLQPVIENGWYWAPTGARIPSPRQCTYCAWSPTGGARRSHPDNREQCQGGKDEACVAILNNFYKDGVKGHDVECSHKKPIICQESNKLLDFVKKED